MLRYTLIAGFGAAGAVARYAVDGWVSNAAQARFPYGTLVINIIGSFILGLLMELAIGRMVVSENWRIALGVGFLGAFTTFSTFSYETVRLFKDSAYYLAIANIAGTLLLGLAAAGLGIALGRAL